MVSIRVLVILAFFLLLSFNLPFPTTMAGSRFSGIQSDSDTGIQSDSNTNDIPAAAAALAKPTESEAGVHVEENSDGTNRGRHSKNSKSGSFKNLLQSNRRSSKSINNGNNNEGNGRNSKNNRYNGNGSNKHNNINNKNNDNNNNFFNYKVGNNKIIKDNNTP